MIWKSLFWSKSLLWILKHLMLCCCSVDRWHLLHRVACLVTRSLLDRVNLHRVCEVLKTVFRLRTILCLSTIVNACFFVHFEGVNNWFRQSSNGALRNFFGQTGRRPPKSDRARTPMPAGMASSQENRNAHRIEKPANIQLNHSSWNVSSPTTVLESDNVYFKGW